MATLKRRLSYSQMRQFTECRWAWRKLRIDHHEVLGKSRPMEVGSIFHAAVESYLNHLVKTRQEYAPQDLPKVWQAFHAPYLIEYGETVPLELFGEVYAVLEKFVAQYRLDVQATWQTEAGLGVTWDGRPCGVDDPDAGLIGYLDLVKVRGFWAEIEDWKSGWWMLPGKEMQDDLQVRTYAMLLWMLNPALTEIHVTLHYPRYGVRRTALFTPNDNKETWQRWLALSDTIETALADLENEELWKPTPGKHCLNCNVADLCPIGIPRLKALTLLQMEDRETIGQTILVVEAGLKLLKAKLKGAVQATGPVLVGDGKFDLWLTRKVDWDVHAALRLAKGHFVEPTRFLRVGATELKKVAKTDAPFVKALEKESRVKESLEFEWRKVDAEMVVLPPDPLAGPPGDDGPHDEVS